MTTLNDAPIGALVRTTTGIKLLVGRRSSTQTRDGRIFDGRHVTYLAQDVPDKKGRVWHYPMADAILPLSTPITILKEKPRRASQTRT